MVDEALTSAAFGGGPSGDCMSHIHDAPANAAEAARLLGELWDEAREIAAVRRQAGDAGENPGGLGWLPPANVAGVHLYVESGGWRADLTVDGLRGRPTCIGSRRPLPTRDAARTFALSLLCDVVLGHAETPRMPSALSAWPARPTAFVYDGLVIPLPAGAVAALLACGAERISEAYVRRRLGEVRKDLLAGAALSTERLASLAPNESRAFHTVCALGALRGLPGWHDVPEA